MKKLVLMTLLLLVSNVTFARTVISHLNLSDFKSIAGIKLGDDCEDVLDKYADQIKSESDDGFRLLGGAVDISCDVDTWKVSSIYIWSSSDTTWSELSTKIDKTFIIMKGPITKRQFIKAFGKPVRESDYSVSTDYTWYLNSTQKLSIAHDKEDKEVNYFSVRYRK